MLWLFLNDVKWTGIPNNTASVTLQQPSGFVKRLLLRKQRFILSAHYTSTHLHIYTARPQSHAGTAAMSRDASVPEATPSSGISPEISPPAFPLGTQLLSEVEPSFSQQQQSDPSLAYPRAFLEVRCCWSASWSVANR